MLKPEEYHQIWTDLHKKYEKGDLLEYYRTYAQYLQKSGINSNERVLIYKATMTTINILEQIKLHGQIA